MKLQTKFTFTLALVFVAALVCINFLVNQTLSTLQARTLTEKTVQLQQTSKRYIMQFNELNVTSSLVESHAKQLTQNLSNMYRQSVALYTFDGHVLHETVPAASQLLQQNPLPRSAQLLTLAQQNKASYLVTGNYLEFAYPIYIYGEPIGILHFTEDYSETAHYYSMLHKTAVAMILIIFALIFVVIFVLTRRISTPITALSQVTKQIAKGRYDTPLPLASRDEVGELTNAIDEMRATIYTEQQKQTRFFQHLTHELKTPIASISGYAQILSDPTLEDPIFQVRAAVAIKDNADDLHSLVQQLLRITKAELQTRTLQQVDVLTLAQTFTDATGSPLFIEGNLEELRILFGNIIRNAHLHGSDVVVTVDTVVTISNAAPPIPEQVLAHIFEPFVHGNQPSSNGLGLYIAKQIMDAHNGAISFTYQQGRAVVTLDFGNKLATTV